MGTVLISGIFLVVAGTPEISLADIYRWVDDSGVIHFTDSPSNIPEKYRNRKKMILQGPPESGQSSFSTMGASPSSVPAGPSHRVPPSPASVPEEQATPPEDGSRETEQLRARIAAKEQFIAGIDRKRSHALNPMGNRFVSTEDLELYKKYSDELPKDRERLREIDPSGR